MVAKGNFAFPPTDEVLGFRVGRLVGGNNLVTPISGHMYMLYFFLESG